VSGLWTMLAQYESTIAVLLIASVFSIVQAATPNIIGIDGYYHIKVARLIREHGFHLDFTWLQLTILGPGRYADHHFLFHALQAPFTAGDLRIGGKMASVVFATAGLYISYLFMARNGVRYPLLWTAALLAASQSFLVRQSMARPQALFLILAILAIWALARNKPILLLPLGVLASWLFDGFPLLLAVPLAACAGCIGTWLLALIGDADSRAQWQQNGPRDLQRNAFGVAICLLGLALGIVTHPYFPQIAQFAILHLLPKAELGLQLDIRLGGEWYPFSPRGFLLRAGPSTAMCVLGLIPPLIDIWKQRLPDWRTLTLGGLAFGLLAMTIRSQRLIEYFPAFAVLFCAWSWSAHYAQVGNWLSSRAAILPMIGKVLAIGIVIGGLAWNIPNAQKDARSTFDWQRFRDGSLWLAANTPEGDRVFAPDWDDFTRMFFWNDHNTYLIGLDPTYMALYDSDLYTLWRRVSDGKVPNPSSVIRDRFGARYILVDKEHSNFMKVAQADPGLETVNTNATSVVFHVRSDAP
jgi:hypothetical protein